MLSGIHTALVTPFDSDLAVDVQALRASVRYQIENGAAGLCPLGGTGEPLSLSLDEHRLIIDTVMEEATRTRTVPVTVGCLKGGQSEVLEIARYAAGAGADAVMIAPPYFYGPRAADIQGHLNAVADAVDLPIVFFHTPGRSGIRLDADTILGLFDAVPAIKGIKDASSDAILAAELIRGAPEVAFLQGLDELLLASHALGAPGAIVSLADLMPGDLAALWQAANDGDMAQARGRQLDLLPLCRVIYSEPNPGPLKFALALSGRPAGGCRPPIYSPTEGCRRLLERLLGAN